MKPENEQYVYDIASIAAHVMAVDVFVDWLYAFIEKSRGMEPESVRETAQSHAMPNCEYLNHNVRRLFDYWEKYFGHTGELGNLKFPLEIEGKSASEVVELLYSPHGQEVLASFKRWSHGLLERMGAENLLAKQDAARDVLGAIAGVQLEHPARLEEAVRCSLVLHDEYLKNDSVRYCDYRSELVEHAKACIDELEELAYTALGMAKNILGEDEVRAQAPRFHPEFGELIPYDEQFVPYILGDLIREHPKPSANDIIEEQSSFIQFAYNACRIRVILSTD